MNIWFVNHYALPPDRPGGTRHYSLARRLVELGHHVTIIASSFDYFTQTEMRLKSGETIKREDIDGITFLWLKTPPYSGNSLARIRNMLSFTFDIWRRKGMRTLSKPDVIMGSSPHLFAALAAQHLASNMSVPFVLEVRDLWPQSLVDLGNFSLRHPFIQVLARIEKYLYKKADHIVTLLPFAAEHIVNHGGNQSKITWVSNGIDLKMVPAPSTPIPKDSFKVMYTGSHGLANGLGTLLEAAALISRSGYSHIHICLVGDGPAKKSLVAQANKLGLSNVSFEASLPKNQLHAFMAEADAFVAVLLDSPLYKYGVSLNKFFDYLSMARPTVVASSARNNPLHEAEAGFTVPPDDPKALADALVKLSQLPATERWAMGMRGHHYVEEHYSFAKLAERLENVLTEAVTRHHAKVKVVR